MIFGTLIKKVGCNYWLNIEFFWECLFFINLQVGNITLKREDSAEFSVESLDIRFIIKRLDEIR